MDRLTLLEDRAAVQELCLQYGRLLDAGRLEDWAALFVDDGVLDLGSFGRLQGRGALVSAMSRILAGAPRTTHLVGMPTVVVDGDDAAGECGWVALQAGPEGATVARVGRHRDRYRRTADGWRIVERCGLQDLPRVEG